MRVVIKTEELKKVLKKSIEEFYEKDKDLIDNNVHEQACSHRIACYIEEVLAKFIDTDNYSIDVEYNRSLGCSKKYFQECGSAKCNNKCLCYGVKQEIYDQGGNLNEDKVKTILCRPDIIVHTRNNNENNLMIIETKKKNEPDGDDKKLTYMSCGNSQYKYKLGAFVVLEKERVTITYFKDGKKQENEDTANVNTNAYGKIKWE